MLTHIDKDVHISVSLSGNLMSTLEKFCPWRVQCICINFAVMVVKSKANALQKAIKNRSRRGDHSSFFPLIVPFPSTVIVQLTSSCTLLLKFH